MEAHHWTADINELVIDTIPKLVKSKDAVIQFFENCGVPSRHLAELIGNSLSSFFMQFQSVAEQS